MRAIFQVLTGEVLCKGLWGLAHLILIRWMPTDEFSVLTLASAWTAMVFSGCFQSVSQVYVIGHNELNLADRDRQFLTVQCTLAVVGLCIGAIVWRPSLGILLPWMVVVFVTGLNEFSRTRLRQKLAFRSYAIVEVVKTGVFLFGLASCLVLSHDTLSASFVLWLHAGAVVAALAVAQVCGLSALFPGNFREAARLAKQILLGKARYICGYFMLISLCMRLDILLLEAWDSPQQLAIYGAAYRFYGLFAMVLHSLHVVLLPVFQQAQQPSDVQAMLKRQRLLCWTMAPILGLLAYSAAWWFPLVDGGRYPEGINVFRVLTVSVAIGLVFSPYVAVLFRHRDYRFLWRLVVGATFAQLVVCSIAIAGWRALGAALATTFVFGVMNYLIYRRARGQLEEQMASAHGMLPSVDQGTRKAA